MDKTQVYEAVKKLDRRTNTYVPVSGGCESAWALSYAHYHKDHFPAVVHWYDPRYGMFADASLFYAKKQAEYYGYTLVWDSSKLSEVGYTKEIPIIVTGIASFMTVALGKPHGMQLKWIMSGANSEDDLRMRIMFREYRKIMACIESDALDASNISYEVLGQTPQLISPGEFLTKSEMLAMMMTRDPNLVELIWTCPTPKGVLKNKEEITGYVPCGVCYKCQELESARKTAQDAVMRYAMGVEYYSKFWRHENKMDAVQQAWKKQNETQQKDKKVSE